VPDPDGDRRVPDETGQVRPDGSAQPSRPGEGAMTQVRLRRAPRYRAFVLTGTALGLIAAGVLVTVLPVHPGASSWTVFLYLALGLGVIGALLGAVSAVLVERRPSRT